MHLNGKVNYNPQGVVVVVVPVVVVPYADVTTVAAVALKVEVMSSICFITTICFFVRRKGISFFSKIKGKIEKFHICVIIFLVATYNCLIFKA